MNNNWDLYKSPSCNVTSAGINLLFVLQLYKFVDPCTQLCGQFSVYGLEDGVHGQNMLLQTVFEGCWKLGVHNILLFNHHKSTLQIHNGLKNYIIS